MEIKIDMSMPRDICPYCFGLGKLKAMQRAMTYEGVSVRTKDTFVKCNHCKGTGLLKK